MRTIPVVPHKHHLQLRLLDIHGDPLKEGTRCAIDTPGEKVVEVKTDANGFIDVIVPAKKIVHLTIYSMKDDRQAITMHLDIRDFGPADKLAGARARLHNLGYLSLGNGVALDGPMDERLARAIDRFSFANELPDALPADGSIDKAIADRLRLVHDEGGSLMPKRGS